MKKIAVVILGALMLLLLSACGMSKEKTVYISEIMSQNTRTYADENGDLCDWIELHNPTNEVVNLGGYVLADNSSNKFTFPELALAPGEHFVVFANGIEKVDMEKRVIHVPLSIGAKGENIYLYASNGVMVCRISVPGLAADTSYGVDAEGKLVIFDNPTPGKSNFEQISDDSVAPSEQTDDGEVTESGIYINEYSTNSTQTLMDEDGDFVAWVEIYNSTDKKVNLKGMSLSDDSFDKAKWVFPSFKIEAGGYAVVYLSGKNKVYDGGNKIHAGFKLNGKEEFLYIFSKTGHAVDKCQVHEVFSNLSYGRVTDNPEQFAFFARSTPGRQNSGRYFDSIDSARYTGNREFTISEVAAVNTVSAHSDGEYYDYVELYNSSGVKLNLGLYKLSDSKDAESFKQLPKRVLQPGEYVTVYFGADEDYVSDYTGDIYVTNGLNRYGETVYLMDILNTVVDAFTYGRLQDGFSCGRDIGSNGDTVYYTDMTPGAVNPASTVKNSLPTPVFSQSSTYLEAGTQIEISADFGEIHVTIDGSTPTKSSPIYTGPITVSRTAVIRAKNFAEGYMPSDTACATYLVGTRRHDLPVVFLTTDEENLYDYNTGIWAMGAGASDEFPYEGANFWQNWERPVNFEYMTEDGVSQVGFDAGISVFGQFSRANDQKSVEIKLKDKYGPSEVCYPFFEDSDVNVFSSFVLRNGGQDYNIAHIRDAYAATVIKGQMDIDIMDYQPVVCYVNGEYHGIYDLREKIDEDYVANHHGADPDKVDLIKANSDVKSGSFDNYEALLDFVSKYDLSQDIYYNKVCQYVDIDELINYWLCESFFTNTDTGNIKFWRENTPGAKWRWIFFDVDWCLFNSTYDYNIIDNYLDPEGHGVGQAFSTTLFRNLYKNKNFRTRMLEIFSYHLKTTFTEERMLSILDELVKEIETEMPYYLERWDIGSEEYWRSNVDTLKWVIQEKIKLFPQQMVEALDMTKEEVAMYLSDV